MSIYIRNIVFACPDPEALATFYSDFMEWPIVRRDWFVVARNLETSPRLAFGDGPGEYRPPRWPDPDHPQQLHVDIAVPDVREAAGRASRLGAAMLAEHAGFTVVADPAGHPFCLHAEAAEQAGAAPDQRISHVVFDCFSPRALAGFYEGLMGVGREEDSSEWVIISGPDSTAPKLSFQHAVFPAARWPDPSYPQQIHLDFHVDDGTTASDLAVRLGAVRLADMGGSCPVFADPAAHPFCLCSPGQ